MNTIVTRAVYAITLSCILVASAARGDRNLDPPVVPQSAEQPLREGVITLYFPGPLNSYHVDLYIANGSSFSVEMIVIDGSVVMPNHIIWDSFGTFEGPATIMALVGEDTQTVTATFVGFDPGETCRFDTLDPDFPNQPNVAVVQLAGVACTVFADGCGAEGVFAVEGNNVVVELEPGPVAVEACTWGATKCLFR